MALTQSLACLLRAQQVRSLQEPAEKNKFDQALLGYAAGVVDCDGSIWVTRYARKSGKFAYRLRLNVTNTRRPLLVWFSNYFGGGTVTSNRREDRAWKTCYCWAISGERAVAFLELVLPYLVIKRKQAVLGLEFGSTHVGSGVPLTENFVRHRERIYQEMRRLNARGQT